MVEIERTSQRANELTRKGWLEGSGRMDKGEGEKERAFGSGPSSKALPSGVPSFTLPLSPSIFLEVACKPDSVPRRRGGGHSSGTVVAGGLKRPTRRPRPGQPWGASLFGLAPQGVFRAFPVTGEAVGSYPAFSPLPAAS